jgi:putative NADPH-quinone reductase
MPAVLKAFLEQVMRPGVALEYRKHGFPRGLLAGRSARLVVTMGMLALIYRWYFRAHGVRGLEWSILGFAGIPPFRGPCWGWSMRRASEAAGLARPDERLRQAPHLNLAQHANEPIAMFNS